MSSSVGGHGGAERGAGSHLLEVEDLRVEFRTEEGALTAVGGVSFHVDRGETLVLVGESGSGKSVTSLAIMRLIDDPLGRRPAQPAQWHGSGPDKIGCRFDASDPWQ